MSVIAIFSPTILPQTAAKSKKCLATIALIGQTEDELKSE